MESIERIKHRLGSQGHVCKQVTHIECSQQPTWSVCSLLLYLYIVFSDVYSCVLIEKTSVYSHGKAKCTALTHRVHWELNQGNTLWMDVASTPVIGVKLCRMLLWDAAWPFVPATDSLSHVGTSFLSVNYRCLVNIQRAGETSVTIVFQGRRVKMGSRRTR